MRVRIPEGRDVGCVDRVAAGFHPAPFRQTEDGIDIGVASLDDVAVYRIAFGGPGGEGTGRDRAVSRKPSDFDGTSSARECWDRYVANCIELSRPLLRDELPDAGRVTEIGRAVGELRSAALVELRSIAQSAMVLSSERRKAVLSEVLDVGIRLGLPHDEAVGDLAAPDDESEAFDLANIRADVYLEHGMPGAAIDALAASAERMSAPHHKYNLTRRLVVLCTKRLKDSFRALPYVRKMVEYAEDTPQQENAQVFLAFLLIRVGEAGEAAAILERLQPGPSVDFCLGHAYATLGRHDDALERFKICARERGEYESLAWHAIGQLHLQRQAYPEAYQPVAKVSGFESRTKI